MTHRSLSAALRDVANVRPGGVAIVAGTRQVTYAELARDTGRLAGLLVEHGVRAGDRVAIFSENRPEYLVALFACSRVGAVLTTIYPSFGQDEVRYIIDHCEPVLGLVEAEQRAVFDDVAGSRSGLTILDLQEAVQAGAASGSVEDDLPRGLDDAALICYTSGTSSRPKAVLHSNKGLIEATRSHIAVWHVNENDRLLVMTPMAWLFGSVTTSLTGLLAGATLVVLPHFHPIRALELIRSEGVTVLMGVGAMYAKLAEVGSALGEVPISGVALRLCLAGGESRNAAAMARFQELFKSPVHDIYAASEVFPVVTYDPLVDPEPLPSASGRVAPGAEVRIVDADGNTVAPGEAGELLARSAASMIRYFRQDELTSAVVDADGWFHTKDLATIDENGFVHIVGRASDMIIRGGANVSPAEVERVLASHVDVREVAVVGVPDETYGQQVAAFVVTDSTTLTAGALTEYAAAHLAKYKVPTLVALVDVLPRTATGKILRSALVRPEV